VGEAMAVPVIRQLKKWIQPEGVVIIDAPPGASCPMVEAVRTADFLLLVTEPTPFGFHDLKSAVEVAREVEIPFGVIINRADIGTEEVAELCKKENIPLLMEIPLDRRIAEAYSRGVPMVDVLPEYREKFLALYRSIQEALA